MTGTNQNESFIGFENLYGRERAELVRKASVCVVGLGGVGSWAVEALARCGVGELTLVDLDEVCVTNINRQLHATSKTVGASKVSVMAERVKEISPQCSVRPIRRFFSKSTAEEILAHPHTMVLDTIDSAENKVLLLAQCVERSIRAVTVGSAGSRRSPHLARVHDLAKTIHDPLLQIVRKELRQAYNFPRSERTLFEIPCVYAPLQKGVSLYDLSCSLGEDAREKGKTCNAGMGSAVFVTGTIGFMAAAETIQMISEGRSAAPYGWFERRAARLAEDSTPLNAVQTSK